VTYEVGHHDEGIIAQYQQTADDRRQAIVVKPENLSLNIDQAISVLRNTGTVFNRGRKLVLVGRDGTPEEFWTRRPPDKAVVNEIAPPYVVELLNNGADWYKSRQKRDGTFVTVRTVPPGPIVSHIFARPEWDIPYLEAIIDSPSVRPDGTVVNQPGYDPETYLYLATLPGTKWPTVPEGTRDEVDTAVQSLYEVVSDFPFKSNTDRSAFVAAILSVVGRNLYLHGPAPMFAFGAPARGSGKTLLATVVSIIATGLEPSAMPYTADGDEMRKRITAIARKAETLVCIDNASGSIGSDEIAAALTTTMWQDRLLGSNDMISVPLRAVWLVTGSNLGFRKTLGRRVVPVDIDPGMEHPEDRTDFRHPDLIAYVKENRERLLIDALTILRGFIRVGKPRPMDAPRMGSFEMWDDNIRSATAWATGVDPAPADNPQEGRGRIRAESDDDDDALVTFLEAVAKHRGDSQWKASDLFHEAQKLARGTEEQEPDFTLQQAIDGFAPAPGQSRATLTSLSFKLRSVKDRRIDGKTLRRKKQAAKACWWYIEGAEPSW
jgi:hypothetical protein